MIISVLRCLKSFKSRKFYDYVQKKEEKKKKNKMKETSLTVDNHRGADFKSMLYHIVIHIVFSLFCYLICRHRILQHSLYAACIFGDGSEQEDQEDLGITTSCDKMLKRRMTCRTHSEILPTDKRYTAL